MAERQAVELGVLGTLRAVAGDAPLDLGPPQRRTVLAVLATASRQVVPTWRLVDCVWPDEAGDSALGSLQVHVSRLRKVLGRRAIVRHPHGYSLEIEPDQLDADVFSRLVRRGRTLCAHDELRRGRDLLVLALALWRGRAYEEFEDAPWARCEIVRLESERLTALEARLDADLELADADVLGELESLVVEHPLHEGFCAQLMVASYRAGRQSEALAAGRRHRCAVHDATGLGPSPALAALEQRILHHDLPPPGAAHGPARARSTRNGQPDDK